MQRRKFLAAVGTASVGAIAGCGGSDDGGTDRGSADDTATDTPANEATDTKANEATDTPTEESTDTPTDEPTDSPTAEPSGSPELVVDDHELLEVAGEYSTRTFVKGLVTNVGSGVSGAIEVEGVFYDENGDELESSVGLMTGLKSDTTWEVYLEFLGEGSVADYEFDVAHDSSLQPDWGLEGAEVAESELDTSGDVHVTGTVENTGESSLSYVEVDTYFYADDGNLLGFNLANENDLEAGGTWEFSTQFLSTLDRLTARVSDYEVHLAGY